MLSSPSSSFSSSSMNPSPAHAMAAFRELRPSAEHVQQIEDAQPSSACSSEAGGPSNDRIYASPTRVRRRRPPAHVSLNACTNCKRARAKCDGKEPETCTRCRVRDLRDSCHYEIHVKTAKEEMVRRINGLEHKNQELRRSVKEENARLKVVLGALTSGERTAELVARLRAGQSGDQVVAWLRRISPPDNSVQSLLQLSDADSADADRDWDQSWRSECGSPSSSVAQLTVANVQLTDHLIVLFFTWVHPAHTLFSEHFFMKGFVHGDRKYCSPAMVNVMCAMGCHYHNDLCSDGTTPLQLRKRLLQQALTELAQDDPGSLTCILTYALFFLVEMSGRQARKASSYLRLAVEGLAALDCSPYAPVAVEVSSKGIHALSALWASLTRQQPAAVFYPAPTPSTSETTAFDGLWHPYCSFRENATKQVPSLVAATADAMARLGHIIHDMLALYDGRDYLLTAPSLSSLCCRLCDWKRTLPPSLAVSTDGGVVPSHPLPHVLSMHIYYHVALCQLYRPLLELAGLSRATRASLSAITTQSALDGLCLLERYQCLYTNHYQSPLLAFCVVHICETLLQTGTEQDRALRFALEATHESAGSFAYVGPLQSVICQTARQKGVGLPADVRRLMGGRTSYGPEEMLDACERMTLVQPYSMLRNVVNGVSLGISFEREWEQTIPSDVHSLARTGQWSVIGGGGGGSSGGSSFTSSRDAAPAPQRSHSTSSCTSVGSSSTRSMHINSVVNP